MRTDRVTGLFMIVMVCLPAIASDQQGASLSRLPLGAQSSISTALGRDVRAYHIQVTQGAIRAENSKQDLAARFSTKGVEVSSGNMRWRMSLCRFGYGDDLKNTPAVAPLVSANRVEYRRGSLTEWYVNGPAGLEQGFTIHKRPGTDRGEPLTIALTLSGDLTATPEKDGGGLTLRDRSQREVLRYAGLTSYDATGKQLPTWMDVQGGQLRLRVKDSGAVYPLVVDPWVQTARLAPSDGEPYEFLGDSISVSGDGKTIAVGVELLSRIPALRRGAGKSAGSSLEQGAVYVFVEPSTGWSTTSNYQAQLTAADGKNGDLFGCSVAISSDAKTIVVGAQGGAPIKGVSQPGAVYVYTEPAAGWATTSTPAATLTASDGTVYDWLGSAVAFDGQSVYAGAFGHTVGNNPFQGAVYVYTEPSGGWTDMTQTAELTASDGQAWDLFGYSVSASNGVAVVGAIQATVNSQVSQGSGYVFIAPTTGWVNGTENAKLLASDGIAEDFFGSSVAISLDTTLVVAGAQGATVNGNGQGAAYVFAEPSGGWAGTLNQTAKLTASNGLRDDYLGASVAIGTDANTIVLGAPLAPYSNTQQHSGPGPGRVYTYTKPSGGWIDTSQYTQELHITGGRNGAEYGTSVGINGTTLAAGTPNAKIGNKTDEGAAFISVSK
jgi:hypothetical protein